MTATTNPEATLELFGEQRNVQLHHCDGGLAVTDPVFVTLRDATLGAPAVVVPTRLTLTSAQPVEPTTAGPDAILAALAEPPPTWRMVTDDTGHGWWYDPAAVDGWRTNEPDWTDEDQVAADEQAKWERDLNQRACAELDGYHWQPVDGHVVECPQYGVAQYRRPEAPR